MSHYHLHSHRLKDTIHRPHSVLHGNPCVAHIKPSGLYVCTLICVGELMLILLLSQESTKGESAQQTIVSWIIGLLGAGSAAVAAYYMGRQVKDTSVSDKINEVKYAFSDAKLQHGWDVWPYIPREALKQVVKEDIESETIRTLIISGPRGCGKSTLVQEVLQDKAGVVSVAVDESGIEGFAGSIVGALIASSHLTEHIPHTTLVTSALTKLQKEQGEMPTIIVEVNERCTGDQLEKILLFLKYLGDDRRLARSVVVLSSSRTVLELVIGIDELRAKYRMVGDLTIEEAREFLIQLLSRHKISHEDVVVNEMLAMLGTRLLDLHNFLAECKNCSTVADLRMALTSFTDRKLVSYNWALNRLLEELGKQTDISFVRKLAFEEPVSMQELYELTGKSPVFIVQTVAKIHPHPFYVDPNTMTVTRGSHFMSLVIKKKVKELEDKQCTTSQ